MRYPAGSRKVNCILLAVYFSFISISHIISSDLCCLSYLGIGSLLCIILALSLAPFLINRFSVLSLPEEEKLGTDRRKTILLLYGIPLLVLFCYYIAYYPGAFSPDSMDQYGQAISNQYNDWHPVLHTLIAFKLPLTISGGWIGSIVLFQILLFSVSLGYCFQIINEYAGKTFTIVTMLFVLGNPLTCNIAMYPWKDVSFAIGTLLLMTFSLQIFISKGNWMVSPLHMTAFIVVFVLTTIFRHNAILFTAPLLFAVLFQISPKRVLLIASAIILLISAIKGPLYKALQVESPDKRQVETLGLPMTVIGAAVKYAPEKMDDEILRFAYSVAPAEIWDKYYSYGDFNSVKFLSETDLDVIEEYGRDRVIQLALMCFKKTPSVCLRSLVKLTDGIYTVTDPHPVGISPDMTKNTYGIVFSTPETFKYFPNSYNLFIQDFFPRVFLYYGVFHLAIVITVLAKSKLNRFSDWKRVFFILPMFLYNYGTSLLLTANNDSPRFFYYTVLIFPLLLLFFYREVRSE